jgi:polysaccharide export outer membrane protein
MSKLKFALGLSLLLCGASIASAEQAPASVRTTAGREAQRPVAAVPPADYLVGSQDVLGIVFWREPDLSGDVTVRPDGKITIPVIGEIKAAGRTPEELQADIAAAASKFITDVNVVVVVRTINSRRVFVMGRVTSPGAFPLMGPLTVMQAIALAGGLTDFADPKGITILRMENGKSRNVPFNYQDIIKGRSLEQNILLRPDDTVVVP